MRTRNFVHKGVRRLFLQDDRKAVPAAAAGKLRRMTAFLQDMESADELYDLPGWNAHRLRGDRQSSWGLKVTRNWRLTFSVEGDKNVDINLKDYH